MGFVLGDEVVFSLGLGSRIAVLAYNGAKIGCVVLFVVSYISLVNFFINIRTEVRDDCQQKHLRSKNLSCE